jgi:hypothetical protein
MTQLQVDELTISFGFPSCEVVRSIKGMVQHMDCRALHGLHWCHRDVDAWTALVSQRC